MNDNEQLNIFDEPLALCSTDPMTGFYRNGYCHTGVGDVGLHLVAARMTDEFLSYSKSVGNDLSTPRPEYDFAGLKAGDYWCVCALRWKQAEEAGVAPPVNLHATHKKTLQLIPLATLKRYADDALE